MNNEIVFVCPICEDAVVCTVDSKKKKKDLEIAEGCACLKNDGISFEEWVKKILVVWDDVNMYQVPTTVDKDVQMCDRVKDEVICNEN